MNQPGLSVEVEPRGEHARLIVSGELDLLTASQVARSLETVLVSGTRHVVMDVGGVTFVDSSGLRALLRANDDCAQRGVTFTLAVPPGPVADLLTVAGVQEWFSYE